MTNLNQFIPQPTNALIKDLLLCNKLEILDLTLEGYTLVVVQLPGFQRFVQLDVINKIKGIEYPFNKKKNLSKKEYSEYFYSFDKMIVSIDHDKKEIRIIDGQQRVSIFTAAILFSAFSAVSVKNKEIIEKMEEDSVLIKVSNKYIVNRNAINFKVITPLKAKSVYTNEFGIKEKVKINDLEYMFKAFNQVLFKMQENKKSWNIESFIENFEKFVCSENEKLTLYSKFLKNSFNAFAKSSIPFGQMYNYIDKQYLTVHMKNKEHSDTEEIICTNESAVPVKLSVFCFAHLRSLYSEENSIIDNRLDNIEKNLMKLSKSTETKESLADFVFQFTLSRYTPDFISKNMSNSKNLINVLKDFVKTEEDSDKFLNLLEKDIFLYSLIKTNKMKKGDKYLSIYESASKGELVFVKENLIDAEFNILVQRLEYFGMKEKSDFFVMSILNAISKEKYSIEKYISVIRNFVLKLLILKRFGINNFKEAEEILPPLNYYIESVGGKKFYESFISRETPYAKINEFFLVKTEDLLKLNEDLLLGKVNFIIRLARFLIVLSYIGAKSRLSSSQFNNKIEFADNISNEIILSFGFKMSGNDSVEFEHMLANQADKSISKSFLKELNKKAPLGNASVKKLENLTLKNYSLFRKVAILSNSVDRNYYQGAIKSLEIKRFGDKNIIKFYEFVQLERIKDLVVYFKEELCDYSEYRKPKYLRFSK